MGREERLACYRSSLARIASAEFSYVIFEDAHVEGRVVQVATGYAGEPPVIEATNVYSADENGLTPAEFERLAALGFDTSMLPYPSRLVDLSQLAPAAELIDAAFLAIGARPDFELKVDIDGGAGV